MAIHAGNTPGANQVRHVRPSQEGFTIVEMITAMVIFAIAVTMITSIFTLIQDSQRNAMYFTVATHAARSEVDRLRSSGYASLTKGNTYPIPDLPTTLPVGSTGSVVVDANSPSSAPDTKRIDVTISYPIGTTTKNVTITSYVAEPETVL